MARKKANQQELRPGRLVVNPKSLHLPKGHLVVQAPCPESSGVFQSSSPDFWELRSAWPTTVMTLPCGTRRFLGNRSWPKKGRGPFWSVERLRVKLAILPENTLKRQATTLLDWRRFAPNPTQICSGLCQGAKRARKWGASEPGYPSTPSKVNGILSRYQNGVWGGSSSQASSGALFALV